jgi:hypothetical protein
MLSEFEKYLSLNYHACFGAEEAIKQYYETGILSKGNFQGMGRSHLVKVSDMIEYLLRSKDPKDKEYAKLWSHYSDQQDIRHFYDTFRLKSAQYRTPKHFNHKLYAIEMLDKDMPVSDVKALTPWYIRALMAMITMIIIPLRYIPEKSVMRMPESTYYTLRIGSVFNGYSIEIQIPKKFSFKEK